MGWDGMLWVVETRYDLEVLIYGDYGCIGGRDYCDMSVQRGKSANFHGIGLCADILVSSEWQIRRQDDGRGKCCGCSSSLATFIGELL